MNTSRLAVVQFHGLLFELTETFIYNYLTAFRRILPIALTFKIINREQFPYRQPLIELYSWRPWMRWWRGLERRLWKPGNELTVDQPKTFNILRQYQVQVLHAHFGHDGPLLLPIKRKTGLPLITTFYGQDVSALPAIPRWQQAYVELFAEGDLFLVEGPVMQQRLIGIGCPPDKSAIQRIAIPLKKYPFRQRLPKSSQSPVRILFCASFKEKKGLQYALDAVRQVRPKVPNLEFHIIGDGELRPQVEQMLATYQMHPYTHLLGFQSHQRMLAEMDAADIFLQPSITATDGDTEGGAPTTILEAQACGLPVLTTHHADIPNVVDPENSALLAPERDAETLSAHLLMLLKEPERWAVMGTKGRTFVAHYHNIEVEVQCLEDRYAALACQR